MNATELENNVPLAEPQWSLIWNTQIASTAIFFVGAGNKTYLHRNSIYAGSMYRCLEWDFVEDISWAVKRMCDTRFRHKKRIRFRQSGTSRLMLLDHRSALFVVARQQNILTTNVGSPMVSNATNSHGFRRKTAIQFTRERVVRKYASNSTKISHEKKALLAPRRPIRALAIGRVRSRRILRCSIVSR
jgi:hypothetical protein